MLLKPSMFYSKIKILWVLLWGSMSIGYPFLIYFFGRSIHPLYLLLVVVSLGIVKTVWSKNLPHFSNLVSLTFVLVVLSLLYLWKGESTAYYYPFVMSLSMAFLFGFSLIYPPTLIERLARIKEPNLDENGIKYTRKITLIWTAFCFINAAISLGTILSNDRELWVLYNGCISYIMMGLLFGGEFLYRYLFIYPLKVKDNGH